MAARGTEAKNAVEAKLKESFGTDYIGKIDGKYYVWADDGGERVQIAIAMTCPKVLVGETINLRAAGEGLDFSGDSQPFTAAKPATEISKEEEQNIEDLIKALGL